jgi:midasin (ATPase involved in ribosome maturation)
MAIIIGPSASMKTNLVRLLAQLSGNQLHSFAVNSQLDTTELLGISLLLWTFSSVSYCLISHVNLLFGGAGSYEQVDLNRHKKELVDLIQEAVRQCIEDLIFKVLSNEAASLSSFCIRKAQELQNTWSLFSTRSKFIVQNERLLFSA